MVEILKTIANFVLTLVSNCFYIFDFTDYLLSLPSKLVDWFSAFPTFIASGMYFIIIAFVVIISIRIIVLLKELIA